jgi:16S rRNA processing protein rimM
MQNYLEIGQVVNTFGIKGFVKVNPYTDDIRRFDDLKSIYLVKKNQKTEYEIEEVNYQKNVVLLKLKGIDDMTKAESLRDSHVVIDRKDAVKLPEDSYFIVDLIGLDVFSEENTLLRKNY